MIGGWLGLFLCLGAAPQEEKKAAQDPLLGDAVRALRATAKAGGYRVLGELKTEVREDQTEEEPTEGDVSGGIQASPFQAALRVKAGRSIHEIYYKEGKLVGRLVWRAVPADLGKSPSELLSLVNLDRLAVYAEKATQVRAGQDEKIGSQDCRAIRIRLPADTIRGHSDDTDASEEDEKGLDAVEAELFIDKNRGTVARLSAKVLRVYKDEGDPAASHKAASSYDLRFEKLGEAKAEIPKDLERQFED